MTAQIVHKLSGFDDLKELATAKGPCITAVVPLPNPSELKTRIKNTIRGIQKQLAEYGVDPRTASGLIAPIEDVAEGMTTNGTWAHALILFRSPGLFDYYLLHGQFQEAHVVQERFQVRPLLQTLAHETTFHLLGLSQRQVRLFDCTQYRAEPAAVDARLPQSLQSWMNSDEPDHVLASRSAAGPSVGKMKGVVSGTSAEHEREDAYLAHFFKAVDRGVIAHLRHRTGPLVLAGVDYELAIYRRINSYRPTLENAVSGSPDGVPDRMLHERAMKVVTSTFSEPLQKAIMQIREHAGTARSSTDPRTVVQAAFQGRVSDLLIAANAAYWGAWNHQTQEVGSPGPARRTVERSGVGDAAERRACVRAERIGYAGQAATAAFFRF